MKSFTKFLFIIFAAGLISCNNSNDAGPTDYDDIGNQTQHENNDSTQNNKSDSKITDITANIDSLKTDVDSLKNRVSEFQVNLDSQEVAITNLKEENDSLKNSTANKYFWIFVALCIVSCIIAIITFLQVSKISKNSKSENTSNEDDKKEAQSISQTQDNTRLNEALNGVRNLKSKIAELEMKLRNLETTISSKNNNSTRDIKDRYYKTQDTEIRTGYFGDIIGNTYFRELFASKNDQSFFSANIRDNSANFEPIDINVLKGNDNLRPGYEVVQESTAKLQEAINMKVISPGVAEKEGERWVIKTKAKIKLSK